MFCKNCGQQLDDNAVVCPHCGCPTDNFNKQKKQAVSAEDAPSTGFAVLCFFFPVVGLILYLVWHDTMPLRAKSCGKGALIGVIVEVAAALLVTILSFIGCGIAACSTSVLL